MKRLFVNLSVSVLLLVLGVLVPHSIFQVTLEVPAPTSTAAFVENHTAPVIPALLQPLTSASVSPVDATPAALPVPERDPLGELYFTIQGYNQPARLVRLPGSCVVGLQACPAAETVTTPFAMKDVFTTVSRGIAWSRDGQFGVLVVHPEDELSRGRTAEELAQLETQSPADFDVATSTIYLFDAATDAWRAIYQAERKFVYTPVWSADGQWLAFMVRSSVWAFHQFQDDDGVYVIHPDGTGLQQLSSMDAIALGWIGNSIALQRNTVPYPAIDYAIEMLSLDGQVTSLFKSDRIAYYNLAPDGGALLVSDMHSPLFGSPQKAVDLLALDGSVVHSFGYFNNLSGSIWAISWSRDSSQVAFANLRRVYVARRDGEARQIFQADDTYVEPSIWNTEFSPDQEYLLLDVYDGIPKMVVVSLETGQATTLTWEKTLDGEQHSRFSWRP